METFNWIVLEDAGTIDSIIDESYTLPAVLFKHSTRCSISAIAKYRLESDAPELKVPVKFYYLDLIAHRNISAIISECFQVHHESPQILVIKNGECVLDSSHLDIQVSEISEVLS